MSGSFQHTRLPLELFFLEVFPVSLNCLDVDLLLQINKEKTKQPAL